MTVQNSTKSKRPDKPFPAFPLFAHNNGQWARKIRGKIHCFGTWDDHTAALERHNKEYPYLKAGVPVPDSFDGLTVAKLCNKFLAVKDDDRAAGEITDRWFDDLVEIGELIVANFNRNRAVESLGPDDFRKLRKVIVTKHSPTIARNRIARVKAFFRFAWENQLIDRPVRYGDAFKPPRKALERKHRAAKGEKVFEAAQVKALLAKANKPMKAAILLMVNCGLRSMDIRTLPFKALDLDGGWLDFPRGKTGIQRRSKLWPETVEAVRDYIDSGRPKAESAETAEMVFVTRYLRPWSRSALSHEFGKVCTAAKLEFGSPEWCCKTCQTVGEESLDFVAVSRIMGHADQSISGHYRERVTDARLQAVADHMRKWLFGAKRKRGAK